MVQACGLASGPCECSLPANKWKLRDKMHIHFGCSMTHRRAKLVPHWIPQFHQIFTSLASSKMKTDKKFSCVFVWTWRRAKDKLVNNKINHRSSIKNSYISRVHISFVQLKPHRNSHYTWQLAVNFNWRWQKLVNVPSGVNEIQKQFFSSILKGKKSFFPIFLENIYLSLLNLNSKKIFFSIFC